MIDEKTLLGLELKVLGRLSTNDSIEMIRKVIEKISVKKIELIKAKVIQWLHSQLFTDVTL